MHSHCFEPDPTTSRFLTKNIELNNAKNISAHRYAIADARGQNHVSINQYDSGSLSLDAPSPTVEECYTISIGCVNASDLSDIIPTTEQELIIRINIEGYERVVIGELLKCEFSQHIEHVFFEAGGSKENIETSMNLSIAFSP